MARPPEQESRRAPSGQWRDPDLRLLGLERHPLPAGDVAQPDDFPRRLIARQDRLRGPSVDGNLEEAAVLLATADVGDAPPVRVPGRGVAVLGDAARLAAERRDRPQV